MLAPQVCYEDFRQRERAGSGAGHQRLPVKKARAITVFVALVPFAFVVFFVLGSTVGSL
jgi:hypothetical protein